MLSRRVVVTEVLLASDRPQGTTEMKALPFESSLSDVLKIFRICLRSEDMAESR
jgi:hypothetical protein